MTLTATGQAVEQGWQARLTLAFSPGPGPGGTILRRNRHVGPLRVQRPFFPEGGLAHAYILHPPGGVVGGDRLQISVDVDNGAEALCTTPGAAKFYASSGERAEVRQRLHVGPDASLEWLPQENILFAGARLRSRTTIELHSSSRFVGFDCQCLGRPSCDERFHHGHFDSRLELSIERRPLLRESLRLHDEPGLTAAAGLRGRALQATLLAYPCGPTLCQQLQDWFGEQTDDAGLLMAATLIDGLLVVRALARDSETIKDALIKSWRYLRPEIIGRTAVIPRIWAT